MQKTHRRDFLKTLALTVASIPFAGSILTSFKPAFAAKKEIPLPPGEKPVSESDPVAMALGFKHDVKDIDYAKYPQRKKPTAKNQFCDNCALYTKQNEGWGKCQLLANGLVNAKGWCGSWSKKA